MHQVQINNFKFINSIINNRRLLSRNNFVVKFRLLEKTFENLIFWIGKLDSENVILKKGRLNTEEWGTLVRNFYQNFDCPHKSRVRQGDLERNKIIEEVSTRDIRLLSVILKMIFTDLR